MDTLPKGYELYMLNQHQTTGDKGLKGFPLSKTLLNTSSDNRIHDLDESKHSTLTVSVVELGCVGFPLALSLSNKISVIGFDTNSKRIHKLKNLVTDKDRISGTKFNKVNLHLTDDPKQLEKCNFIIVTASLPFNEKGEPNLGPLLAASKIVGAHLQNGTIVVYECILYPGATEEILIPSLEKYSLSTSGTDFYVGYSPGSINKKKGQTPPNAIKVVAGHDQEILNIIKKVYNLAFEEVYPVHSIIAAESSIVIDNTEYFIFTALLDELAALFDCLVKDALTCSASRKK